MLSRKVNGHEHHLAGIAASMDESLYDSLASLIEKIYVARAAGPVHTVLLTALTAYSGVSYLSSCMATLTAQIVGPTLLVDGAVLARLARSGQRAHRLDCTRIDGTHLWYLGAEEASRLKTEPDCQSRHLKPVVDSLRQEFGLVIVDAPSLEVSDIAEALAPLVDGTVFVAVQNKTEVHDLEVARFKLTSRGGILLGSIYSVNQQVKRIGENQ